MTAPEERSRPPLAGPRRTAAVAAGLAAVTDLHPGRPRASTRRPQSAVRPSPAPAPTSIVQQHPGKRLTMLDLRQLSYFVAVAEHRSFTRAARAIYIGQPSLSAQVQALERQLGVALLERTSRRVDVTPAGEALLPRARVLLEEAQRFADDARGASSQPHIRLDVSYEGGELGTQVVQQLIDGGSSPTALEVHHRGGVGAMVPRLRSKEIDVGLGRADHLSEEFEHEVLRYEPLVIAHKGDRFARRLRIGADELRGPSVAAFDLAGTAPEWADFVTQHCGARVAPQHATGLLATLSLARAGELYVATAGMALLLTAAGWSHAEVDGWPPYPCSAIWLRSRRHERAVVAVRTAVRGARERLGWLPASPPGAGRAGTPA